MLLVICMGSNPRVSVIIATYNRASWLQEAVSSVLAQSFSDFEIIIADDGSTDNTPGIVAQMSFAGRYLLIPHSGRPSMVRNRALDVARGDLIAFLDDDDLWPAGKLQKQVAAFDRSPNIDLLYGDARALRDDSPVPSAPLLSARQKRADRLFEALLADCFIYPSTAMVRRHTLMTVGGFDESLVTVEDYDLWLRLAYQGRAVFLPEPAVILRRHDRGISALRRRETAEATVTVLSRVWNEMELTPRQRLMLRQSLARSHTHLGLYLRTFGEEDSARRHFWQALRYYPLRRRAWRELLVGRQT
jgi:glycosyltransferase involved in cell wall biosynthesis